MIAYDDTAGVYEAFADPEARQWLGAFGTHQEAADAVRRANAEIAAMEVVTGEMLDAAMEAYCPTQVGQPDRNRLRQAIAAAIKVGRQR